MKKHPNKKYVQELENELEPVISPIKQVRIMSMFKVDLYQLAYRLESQRCTMEELDLSVQHSVTLLLFCDYLGVKLTERHLDSLRSCLSKLLKICRTKTNELVSRITNLSSLCSLFSQVADVGKLRDKIYNTRTEWTKLRLDTMTSEVHIIRFLILQDYFADAKPIYNLVGKSIVSLEQFKEFENSVIFCNMWKNNSSNRLVR